jgi:ribosomal protein S13
MTNKKWTQERLESIKRIAVAMQINELSDEELDRLADVLEESHRVGLLDYNKSYGGQNLAVSIAEYVKRAQRYGN